MPLYWGIDVQNLDFISIDFFPSMSRKYSSPSLFITFGVKSILLDIGVATLSGFVGPFDWQNFFHDFTLR